MAKQTAKPRVKRRAKAPRPERRLVPMMPAPSDKPTFNAKGERTIRRLFADHPGRIELAKAAGYKHVIRDDGEPARQGLVWYLMEIPASCYYDDSIDGHTNYGKIVPPAPPKNWIRRFFGRFFK